MERPREGRGGSMEISKLKRKMRIGEGDFFLSIYYTPGTIKDDLCASSYDIQ